MRRCAPIMLLALLLGACPGPEPATSVKLRVDYEEGWGLDQLEVKARGKAFDVDVAHELELRFPEDWAGEAVLVEVRGYRARELWARGEVEVEPRARQQVRATVSLALLGDPDRDAGVGDATRDDGSMPDAESDGPRTDAGSDGPRTDAAENDGAGADGAPSDAGPPDAADPDVPMTDALAPDSDRVDAASADAAPADAGSGDGGEADATGADAAPAERWGAGSIQQAYVKTTSTTDHDLLGSSVALSASGDKLAVGMPGREDYVTAASAYQPRCGWVFMFSRASGRWTQMTIAHRSPYPGGEDRFGEAVALSANGSRLAVGAAGDDSAALGVGGDPSDNSSLNSGAVYLLDGAGQTWATWTYLKASNADSDDAFGGAIALSGDGATLAVAAWHEASNARGVDGNEADNSATQAGAVYVFALSGGDWVQQAYLKASNAEAFDMFGSALALSGDGSTLAVGAGGEDSAAAEVNGDQADNSAEGAGAVYVFALSGGDWVQQAYLKADDAGEGALFGVAASLSEDGDTLAVGASMANAGAGEAYVFSRLGQSWTQQDSVYAIEVAGANDGFGAALALSADGATLAVGAPREDSGATGVSGDPADNSAEDAGAVYLYARQGAAWTPQAYLKASNTGSGDAFGRSLALSANGGTLAVGAPAEDSSAGVIDGEGWNNNAWNSGAAYVFAR